MPGAAPPNGADATVDVVGHVAIKLLHFWENGWEFWFAQANFFFPQCGNHSGLDQVLYDHCLVFLSASITSAIRDLACRLHTRVVDNPYKQLEVKLTACYSKSPEPKGVQTFQPARLYCRGCCPLALIDQMLALLPCEIVPNCLFLAVFLCCLLFFLFFSPSFPPGSSVLGVRFSLCLSSWLLLLNLLSDTIFCFSLLVTSDYCLPVC